MTNSGDWWTDAEASVCTKHTIMNPLIFKENAIENESLLKNLIKDLEIDELGSFLKKTKTNSETGFSFEK